MFTAVIIVLVLLFIFAWRFHVPAVKGPIYPFSRYRGDLKTGDVIVVHEPGFVSMAIRMYDGSPATHTGVIVCDGGRTYVCELDLRYELGSDIRISPIDHFIDTHGEIIGVVPARRRLDITVSELSQLDIRFDVTFGIIPLERTVCSTFVATLLELHGVRPWNGAAPPDVTPATYYNDPTIVFFNTNL